MPIRQITIFGTGLIGGSFALALKRAASAVRVIGCDKPEVLERALQRGAIDQAEPDARRACEGSDVVLLATPVGAILDLLERLGPVLPPETLLTDCGSTKGEIMARAQAVFGAGCTQRFLGGHPMAGKELSGIEHADADLFAHASWLVTPCAGQDLRGGRAGEFLALIERIGARIVPLDPAQHDHLLAFTSHLPQMLATALAAAIEEELGADPALEAACGRALREMTRLAASPYSVWRDIAYTNSEQIAQALHRLEQRLAHIRENLRTRELQAEFDAANAFANRTNH